MHECADPNCPGNLAGRPDQNLFREASSPRDVLRAAEHCPILYQCFQAWRQGVFTWEYAMQYAAWKLAERNYRIEEELAIAFRLQAPQPFIGPDGKTYTYTGPCPQCGHKPERKQDAQPAH
jgi:hypothetical protein